MKKSPARLLIPFVFSFFIFVNTAGLKAQNWLWAKQPGGTAGAYAPLDGEGFSNAADNSGNVYQTGVFTDSLVYGADTLISIPPNMFLVKYNVDGVVQWARQATCSTNGNTVGYFVATDMSGNVYVTGSFVDTANFGAKMLTSPSASSMFLVKYDTNGNVLWATQDNSRGNKTYTNAGLGVITDPLRNVYVTGEFTDTITFGILTLAAPPGQFSPDMFLVKYDSAGNVIWAKQSNVPSSASNAVGNAVAVDPLNNIYVTGTFFDTVSFGSQKLISQGRGDAAIFLVKYDQNGNFLWSKQSTNVGRFSLASAEGYGVTTDRWGNVYVAGSFNDSIYFDSHKVVNPLTFPGHPDNPVIVRYDSSGNVVWAITGKPLNEDEQNFASYEGTGIASDTLDHIYFNGTDANLGVQFNWSIKFGSQTFTTPGNPSYESSLIMELDTAGNVLCGTMVPLGGDDQGGIACDPSGKYVYLGQDYLVQYDSVVIGPSVLTFTGLSPNNESPFILRWLPCGVGVPMSVTINKTDATCHGLCNGAASVTVSGGISPYRYSWNTGPGDTVPAISGLCAAGFAVTVTDFIGDTATATVTIAQPVAIVCNITADKDTFCSGDSARVCSINQFASYFWNTGDTSACIIASEAGGYWVTVTDVNGCSAVSPHQNISVYPVSSVSITEKADTLSSFGFIAYQWYFNDSTIPGATSSVYIVQRTGKYSVQVTDSSGCQALSSPVSITISGIQNDSENKLPVIYPDPFSNSIFIRQNGSDNRVEEVEIYDAAGRMVITKKYESTAESLLKIDARYLAAGLYFVELIGNNDNFGQKMVKY